MRFVLSLLSVLLVSCSMFSPIPPVGPDETDQNYFKALDTTVALVTDTGRPYCSGVWHNDMVLTAYHCIDQLEDREVLVASFRDYDYYTNQWVDWRRFGVKRILPVDDMALLEPLGAPRKHTNAPLMEGDPGIGMKVYVFGHPYGLGYNHTEGRVTAPLRINGLHVGHRWTQHNAPVDRGMSGGPVLTLSGRIACVTSFFYGDNHLNGCNHISAVRDILRD